MTSIAPMLTSDLPFLELLHRGKVRDVYALPSSEDGEERVLLVATDRISAFDVVMPDAVPRKGEVLTRLSAYWYGRTAAVVPNAFIAVLGPHNAEQFGVTDPAYFGRSMVMRRAEVLRVECVVRGYLAGSGWRDYQADGRISGVRVPQGLRQADRLLEPVFTPSSKAEPPEHDAPMTYEEVEAMLGPDVANAIRLRSLALYRYGADVCEQRGILIADTKFEFGLVSSDATGGGEAVQEPVLIDEVMTPDSSRFWPADQYEPGRDQASFDKQPLRDWLDSLGWDRESPPPSMPPEAIDATSVRYLEAYRRITGEELPDPGDVPDGA